jgi:hypothetical protein
MGDPATESRGKDMTEASAFHIQKGRTARGDPTLVEEIWAAISSDEVAARVLVTGCATLAVGWLGIKEAIGAIVVSQVLTEAVKKVVQRAKLTVRKTWAAIVVLFLFNGGQRAFAAVRRRLRWRAGGRATARSGVRASALATVAASVLAVGAITGPELALGHSLVGHRRTTLFSAARVQADGMALPQHETQLVTTHQSTLPHPGPANEHSTGPTKTTPEPTSKGHSGPRPVAAGPGGAKRGGLGLRLPVTPPRVEATGPNGSLVVFAVTADRGGVRCSPASGTRFAIGRTLVRCTATDGGRHAAAGFPVIVVDETPPKLALPTGIDRQIRGGDEAITYRASALDVVDGGLVPSCQPRSGSSFPLGTTQVRCSATDAHGNHGSGSFLVRLTKAPPGAPMLELPRDAVVQEAMGPGGAVVTFSVSATGEAGRQVDVRCSQASGSSFPVGTTTVTCRAAEPRGAEAKGSFDVLVRDTTQPDLTLPRVDSVEAVARDGAPVTFSATGRDLVSGELTPTCSPASGSRFGIGTTTVECRVSDAAGNTTRGTFPVAVVDAPPRIDQPDPITVDYENVQGTKVVWTISGSDRVDGALVPRCTPSSGSSFRLGTTTVTCSVTDSSGQEASAKFTVTVRDRVAPKLTLPRDITTTAYSSSTVPVKFDASASDAVDGNVAIVCKPPSGWSFPIGITTVSCSTTDTAGNTATGTFKVTVYDGRIKVN